MKEMVSRACRGAFLSSMFFCYMLLCSDGSYYVGVAEDPQHRCEEHNRRKGTDWTARRLPVELVWTE
jgi:predicted GIY-YIG superfamily endonuclease